MRTNDLTPERLRRLAELRPEHGKVLSLFLDLDPSRFADAAARASAFGSLRNDAERLVEQADGLEHQELLALREDLDRVRAVLDPEAVPADAAAGLAVFACGPAELFEVLRLPEPVDQQVHVADQPFVAPLAAVGTEERWGILLVDKRVARILAGAPREVGEVRVIDDETKGAHQKGGWSQARYQRSIDEEVSDHLRHVADELFRLHQRRPLDHLLLAGPVEAASEMKRRLHNDLQAILRGRFEIDVQSSTDEEVRQAAREYVEQQRSQVEEEALRAVAEGQGTGRSVVGLDEVLDHLTQQRVQTLLLTPQQEALGTAMRCPTCDWLGAGGRACPADGTALEQAPAAELAAQRAITQDADVLTLREPEPLEPYGGIAAVLRY
jgi:peptide chain release factor subunit 1